MAKILEIIKDFNVKIALKNIFTKIDEIIKRLNNFEPNYKVYIALLTQEGINAPTASVLENTLSGLPTLLRDNAGDYRIVLNGEFTENKTFIVYNSIYNTGGSYISAIVRSDSDNILIQTRDSLGGIDDVLYETSIEIKVYN
jgi:hypothetical protein